MKAKSKQDMDRVGVRKDVLRVVSEEIDKMQEDLEKSLASANGNPLPTKTSVKLARSRRETRLTFIFKGSLEETEDRLQKIYKALS